MKTFLRTIGYSIIILALFVGTYVSAQLSSQTVETLDATNVNAVNKTAVISLELSDGNFVKHGFAFKAHSEMVFQGSPTKANIGECIPDIGPGTDPYNQNTYREQAKTDLAFGESYYYYACGETTTGSVVEGEIKFFVIGNDLIQGCTVQGASFSEPGPQHFNGNTTTLTIQAAGCNNGLTLNLKAIDNNTHLLKRIDDVPLKVKPDATGIILMNLKIGEDTCFFGNRNPVGGNNWRHNCISYVEIYEGAVLKYSGAVSELNKENVQEGINHPQKLSVLRGKGALVGNCQNTQNCNQGSPIQNHQYNWKFNSLLSGSILQGGNQNCSILPTGVKWSNITHNSIDENAPRLHVDTTNCKEGSTLEIKIRAGDNSFIDSFLVENVYTVDIDYDGKAINSLILSPTHDEVVVNFRADDDSCFGLNDPDCLLSVQIFGVNSGAIDTSEHLKTYLDSWRDTRSEWMNKGIILANCTGVCGAVGVNWTLLGVEGAVFGENQNPPEDTQITLPAYDPNSPCYVGPHQPFLDGKLAGKTGGYDPACYELLAPLPGIGEEVNLGSGRWAIRDLGNYQLGKYINSMFGVALGILMVLAVIMIIIAGVQYMTVESFYGKGDAKKKITSALMGLILALGIFIILDTINPRLLEVNFGKDIGMATLGIVNDPAEQDGGVSGTDIVISTPPTNICTNRKDRGNYGSGNHNLKYSKITETAQTVGLQDVKADGINVKEGTPMGTSIKYHTEQGLAGKLIELKDALLAQGIEIELTETFGPTILGHGSKCHYTSSCVDLATKNRQYPVDTVEKIIRAADDNGLVAHFEFSKTESIQDYQTMQNELHSRGIDKCMVLYVKHATAWHFSIYDKFNESLTL